MDKATILQLISRAGVVGEGGAGFPAHVKYDRRVETVIANGCECEPLLFTDQHIMRRHHMEIVDALLKVMKVMGARRGVIALKQKYARLVRLFEETIVGSGLELFKADNFYPAGDEQILVYEITGRAVPPLGLPGEVDVAVANVGTLYSVSRAMDRKPVTHKVVTVTGEVVRPALLKVPIGTSVSDCVRQCGGPSVEDPVYIMGGAMMGSVVDTPEAFDRMVITKTSGGIIVLPRGHYLHRAASLSVHAMQKQAASACIQCRYCTDLCPRYLIGHGFETHRVMRAFGAGVDVAMDVLQAQMCCECGVCELFSCPMGLSPRRINALLKARFAENGLRYEGPRRIQSGQVGLRPFRKVPVARLAYKLDIDRYMDIHPDFLGEYVPSVVRVPLQQHIGRPALAQVQVGDQVAAGDCIGTMAPGCLGAEIHASISGVVIDVDDSIVIEGM